jgi:hypothetical protein
MAHTDGLQAAFGRRTYRPPLVKAPLEQPNASAAVWRAATPKRRR